MVLGTMAKAGVCLFLCKHVLVASFNSIRGSTKAVIGNDLLRRERRDKAERGRLFSSMEMKGDAMGGSPWDPCILGQIATESRGIVQDSIQKCDSGHLGMALGCAEIGAVLFGTDSGLAYYPQDPQWLNRDRFVLSAGHGSIFLYTWLHLSGYDLSLDEVKNFRQFKSKTPGHPEFTPNQNHRTYTPGVEATTGPLGQGFANAVGMAAAAKMAAAKFNTAEHTIFSNTIVALAGDGCIQEGISNEAASFAAHEGLDNLVVIFDSNDVTLDMMAEFTQSEDHGLRYTALGWNVVTIDGSDVHAIATALDDAKSKKNGKPSLIIAKTVIGKGIPKIEGTKSAHGKAGIPYIDDARAKLGLPDEKWHVSSGTREFFKQRQGKLKAQYASWQETFKLWKVQNKALAALLEDNISGKVPTAEEILANIPKYDPAKSVATVQSGADTLQFIADVIPSYVSGSADLHASTKNYIKNGGDFGMSHGKTYSGRNIYYGIREHAMGAIMNGFAYFGLFRVSGATFLVFADYLRAAIRLAALSELPVGYIFTHDSIAVGEDGPTHQPVETMSGLRVIPNLDVIRPADPEEVAGAFAAHISRKDGPTALIFTRQAVPTLNEIPVETRRTGTLKGGYIAKRETMPLKLILIGTGSELQHCMNVAADMPSVRVVSMPSMFRFDSQPSVYKEQILPKACTKRISIEAGVTPLWHKYVGSEGIALGTDTFGFCAPGSKVMEVFGMTSEALKEQVIKYFE
eukprot:521295_1